MNRVLLYICLAALALFAGGMGKANAVEEQKAAPALSVSESAVCTGIEHNQPLDTNTIFPSSVEKVYFWTKVAGASAPVQIKHVWSHEGRKVLEVSLKIQYPSHRTWSNKDVSPDMKGNWTVEAVDSEGNVLKTAKFKIE